MRLLRLTGTGPEVEPAVPYATELTLALLAYALGSFPTGYYLLRLRTGQDIRQLGSGTAGSRNVARTVGLAPAAITLAGDAAKGALAAGVAVLFGLEPWAVLLAMAAVVAGHIWPAQLRFRGGKGLATVMGAALVFDYRLVLVACVAAAITAGLTRRITVGGLIAVLVAPLVAALTGHAQIDVIGLALLAAVVLFAHRENIQSIGKEPRRPSSERE